MIEIDVYRIGFGSDLHHLRLGLLGVAAFGRRVAQSWNRRSYWGIWQAECPAVPINAARGLTSNAARRRMVRRAMEATA